MYFILFCLNLEIFSNSYWIIVSAIDSYSLNLLTYYFIFLFTKNLHINIFKMLTKYLANLCLRICLLVFALESFIIKSQPLTFKSQLNPIKINAANWISCTTKISIFCKTLFVLFSNCDHLTLFGDFLTIDIIYLPNSP